MIAKEAMPSWLENMVEKLHRKSEPKFARENMKATLLNIQDFVRENLERYERDLKTGR